MKETIERHVASFKNAFLTPPNSFFSGHFVLKRMLVNSSPTNRKNAIQKSAEVVSVGNVLKKASMAQQSAAFRSRAVGVADLLAFVSLLGLGFSRRELIYIIIRLSIGCLCFLSLPLDH